MHYSLPYVDMLFCLRCAILNLTPRLLEAQYGVEGFPQHGRHAGVIIDRTCGSCLRCKIGWRQLDLQEETAKRVNSYLGSTLAGDGELDAEVAHSVQNSWKNWKRMCGVLGDREHEDPRGGCTGQCWVTENMKILGEAVQDSVG